ncbi:hypothetical protein [uncultured Roseibium sp.]|uniref:hypothetical protein n=1 Tax=uncultured Roseibium sp. TaxID=1936171 RepID=UPI00262BE8E6|nr:hypothetical protein [uncultured Roseibium sp.]
MVEVLRGGKTASYYSGRGSFEGYRIYSGNFEGMLGIYANVAVTKGTTQVLLRFHSEDIELLVEKAIEANPEAAIRALGKALSKIELKR